MIHIKIPCTPPSVNHYYGNRVMGKRVIRYITPKGRMFKNIVEKSCRLESPFPKGVPLSVTIELHFSDRRKRDIDNYDKATLDALKGIAYEDDSQIIERTGRKYSHPEAEFSWIDIYIKEFRGE